MGEIKRKREKRTNYAQDTEAIALQEKVVKRILQLCRARRMSLAELARVSGVNASTIKSIVYGNSKNTGIVTLYYICEGFQISLEEFFKPHYFG